MENQEHKVHYMLRFQEGDGEFRYLDDDYTLSSDMLVPICFTTTDCQEVWDTMRAFQQSGISDEEQNQFFARLKFEMLLKNVTWFTPDVRNAADAAITFKDNVFIEICSIRVPEEHRLGDWAREDYTVHALTRYNLNYNECIAKK
jgi:hypothetical protein